MEIIVGVHYHRNFLRRLVTCLIYLLLAISNSTAKRELSLGKSFKLDCDVKPYSEVKWYKNDKLINPNQTNSRISIKNRGKKSVVKWRTRKMLMLDYINAMVLKMGRKYKSLLIMFLLSQVSIGLFQLDFKLKKWYG